MNLQRDPKTLEGMDEFYAAAELQSRNSENMEEIAQLPALSKENLPPKENCPNQRIRREGSGRISTRRPFNIISNSFGSDLNSKTDPSNTKNVEEFFAAFERQEAAERIMRKWRGEKSPVCSQSLKTRVRRQGTGRQIMPRKYDVKLLGNTEKFMELDEEKLEIEEEKHPVSTFTGSEGQASELITEADDLQLDPFQGKGPTSTFETEEKVNMPPKNLFSSFDNSTGSALERLLNDYMKADSENIQKGSFSRSGLGNYETGKPYPKDVQFDTLNTLPQSQTDSSNTINSQALSVDEVRTLLQLGRLPKKFSGSDRTPPPMLTKAGSPLMSPTPPSRISAALRSRRNGSSGDKGAFEDSSIPSFKNRDEEAPTDATSSPSPHLTTLALSNPSEQGVSGGVRRLSFGGVSQSPDLAEVNSKEGVNVVTAMDLVNSTSPSKQFGEDDKVEMVRGDADLSNETFLSPERSTPVSGTGPTNCNAVVSEHPVNDVPGQQVEESPVRFHKRNAKKTKRQSKNNATTSNCDVHEGGQVVSNGIEDIKKNKKKSEYQRRQSLAGAGTLWKNGVRQSTRIRSRPLEYWRGERFLYGRIHSSLATVIGIKYSSPLPVGTKRDEVPKLKVQSYVDEQYSHLVELAGLH